MTLVISKADIYIQGPILILQGHQQRQQRCINMLKLLFVQQHHLYPHQAEGKADQRESDWIGFGSACFFYSLTCEEQAFLRNHFVVWTVQSSTTLTPYGPSGAASAGCCIATKIGPIELDPSTRQVLKLKSTL